MIKSFKDKETEKVFRRDHSKKISQAIQEAARRKLVMLHAAKYLDDLNRPPGNRLEALIGDRKGQHSIRINEQYRICFVWSEGTAHEVEIVDYHKG